MCGGSTEAAPAACLSPPCAGLFVAAGPAVWVRCPWAVASPLFTFALIRYMSGELISLPSLCSSQQRWRLEHGCCGWLLLLAAAACHLQALPA